MIQILIEKSVISTFERLATVSKRQNVAAEGVYNKQDGKNKISGSPM
jgi:hypothetical protein